MPEANLLFIAVIMTSSIVAAVAALLLSRWVLCARQTLAASKRQTPADVHRSYEFRDGHLTSEISADDPFLEEPEDRCGAWFALSEVLTRINPNARGAFEHLQRAGKAFHLTGQAGRDLVTISGAVRGDVLRITVSNTVSGGGSALVETEGHHRLRMELERFSAIADAMPIVAWREDAEGKITWANANYFRYLDDLHDASTEHRWPPPQLFGSEIRPLPDVGQNRRCALLLHNRPDPMWFELSVRPMERDTLLTAVPAERLVKAENALREFVQTLSKTFADLPIGLAVFDRRRELVLFNPALVSLSTLDAQFLSGRPTLFSFLDQLREKRQMPEPKDYKAWRESIAKLETDAEEGTYHDLWTLPMGQTYRVIGRPHPGGAIAFMFEDISSEVSLTRQFRADLDLYQAAIDQNAAAIAVFSVTGQLVMSNTAYSELWGHDPRELLGVMTLTEATQRWQSSTVPATLWGEIRDYAQQRQDRVIWTDRLHIPDRGELFAQVSPLKGGATMLSFELLPPSETSEPEPLDAGFDHVAGIDTEPG